MLAKSQTVTKLSKDVGITQLTDKHLLIIKVFPLSTRRKGPSCLLQDQQLLWW